VEDEKLEEKILRKVFIWLVASGAIVGGVSGTGMNIQTKDLKNISELYRHFAQGFALRI
jgi:hypothetical protein